MTRISGAASLAASALVAVTLLSAPQSRAQSNPSADQLINSLKPTAQGLHGPTRGIRKLSSMAEPTTDAAAPSPAAPATAGTAPAGARLGCTDARTDLDRRSALG